MIRSGRHSARVTLLAVLALTLPGVAPSTAAAQDAAATAASRTARAPDPKKGDLDKVGDTAEAIVERPLRDLNLMKDKMPPELVAIRDKPYDLSGLKGCSDYAAAVARLTKLIGPDIDSDAARNRKGETPSEFALSGIASAAGSFIPFSGLIRKVSGAEKAERRAQAAVLAGALRRAYLKGVARTRGCKV